MRNALQLSLSSVAVCVAIAGCGGFVRNAAADAVAGAGQAYAADDDPELVKQALPFGLKMIEALLEKSPDDPKLLLAAASGFTQYAWAFTLPDAERLEPTYPDSARAALTRTRKLLVRARRYGLHGLEVTHPGFSERLGRDRDAAVALLCVADVPLAYWTASAWGALISLSKQDMGVVAELPRMEALMGRVLALDEAFDEGAVHEFYLVYDGGRGEASGGSVERAKQHFARALELNRGQKLGPLVSYAEVLSVQAQNRREFDELLDRVLAFDLDSAPRYRLVNTLAQERARRLRSRAADLFLE